MSKLLEFNQANFAYTLSKIKIIDMDNHPAVPIIKDCTILASL